MSRLLGVDHGSRRIGLAIADTETGMAFERPALRRRGTDADLAALAALARAEGVALIVIGLPFNMDGSEGAQAQAAREFAAALSAAGLTVTLEDERLTSWQAAGELTSAGRRPDRRSGVVDSSAARILLQQYLDACRPSPADRPEETE
ncbi:MAG: Holliday junction resolvase RuvX [Candidatus Limnocylindria bacterium]